MKKWQDIWQTKYQSNDIAHVQAGFDKLSPDEWEKLVKTFIDILEISSDANILDVGCGAGAFIEHIDKYKRLSGIDYSANAISKLKSKLKGDFQVGEANQLPFSDNRFDVIISFSCFFYFKSLEYAEQCINEMLRTLLPKGKIFIGDINDIQKIDIYNAIRDPENKERSNVHKMSGGAPDHLFYSKSFFLEIAHKNSLKVKIIDEDELDLKFYTNSLYRYSVIYELPHH